MINPHIVRKTTDPVGAPPEAGIHWINTVTGVEFFSVGTASLADWIPRASAGATIVNSFNGRTGSVLPQSGDYTKAQVGLSNVDNTSDLNKPISTATQTALNLKAPLASPTFTGTVSGITKAMVGLSNVDNTSDANKPISTATQTALNAKEDSITAGTTSQYFRGDKTFQTLNKNAVGLGNVDNTSDINKPVSTAQQIAIDAKVENNLTASTTVAPSKTAVNTALAQIDADNKEYANNQSIINALIFG